MPGVTESVNLESGKRSIDITIQINTTFALIVTEIPQPAAILPTARSLIAIIYIKIIDNKELWIYQP